MTTRHKTPQALEPYLKLPPELNQILLTGTLGCTTTWLIVRFVGAVLSERSSKVSSDGSENDVAVILVSWMRDLAFWKNEIRKSTVRIPIQFREIRVCVLKNTRIRDLIYRSSQSNIASAS
jgi:hypothetical protein